MKNLPKTGRNTGSHQENLSQYITYGHINKQLFLIKQAIIIELPISPTL